MDVTMTKPRRSGAKCQGRLTYLSKARRTTSETVSSRSCALSRAAAHRSSGIRIARGVSGIAAPLTDPNKGGIKTHAGQVNDLRVWEEFAALSAINFGLLPAPTVVNAVEGFAIDGDLLGTLATRVFVLVGVVGVVNPNAIVRERNEMVIGLVLSLVKGQGDCLDAGQREYGALKAVPTLRGVKQTRERAELVNPDCVGLVVPGSHVHGGSSLAGPLVRIYRLKAACIYSQAHLATNLGRVA